MAADDHNRAEAIYQKEAHIDGIASLYTLYTLSLYTLIRNSIIFIITIVRKRMSFRLCPKFCDRFFP